MDSKYRCQWVHNQPDIYTHYHDTEWGVPVYDDKTLFEFLILEGAQAGLSWLTILKRREGYRQAFADFDVEKVAQFDDEKVEKLLLDKGIIRNRLKVKAAIGNAKAFIAIQKEFGSVSEYFWSFVNSEPIKNAFNVMNQIPATSEISDKLSKDLKKRGMKFVGSTIMYAFMQATGIVNDHQTNCFRYNEIGK